MRQLRLVLPLCALVAAPAGAQSWRTLDVARQLLDSTSHQVTIEYAAGRLDLVPAEGPLLYQMQLRYDEQRVRPMHHYTAETNTLELGVCGTGADVSIGGDHGGEMRLGLTRAIPLDLSLELGAVEADLDLGGLALDNLAIRSGASEARLRFETPNRVPMRALTIDVGAASVRASELANANAAALSVDAGVGSVVLDFGGEWRRDLDATVDITLGTVTVRVPSDVGVRVDVRKLLASFEHDGLVRRDGSWYSQNWESARHHLQLDVRTTFGKFELERAVR